MNVRDPLSALPAYDSPYIVNWEIERQYLKPRNAYTIHESLDTGYTVKSLAVHGGDTLFAYAVKSATTAKVYDVTTTASEVDALGTVLHSPAAVKHAGRTYFMLPTSRTPATNSSYWDGSTWNNWGFTESASSVGGACGVSHKGRFYFADGTDLYFTALGQVTGEVDGVFPLGDVLEEDEDIVWMGVLASPTDRAAEAYLALGNQAGEVLVYGGDFPESSNWELLARFKLPQLAVTGTTGDAIPTYVLQDLNDIWVPTKSGIFSIRKLFIHGSSSFEETTVSSKINPQLIGHLSTFTANNNISFASLPEKGKVYVLIDGWYDLSGNYAITNNGVSTMYVYDRVTDAWTLHRIIADVNSNVVAFNGSVYFGCDNHILKYDEADYLDEDIDNPSSTFEYDCHLYSSHTNFGSNYKYKHIKTLEPLLQTDFDGSTIKVQVVGDFGRDVSQESSREVITSTSIANGYSSPTYNVGAKGSYLQWRMTVTPTSNLKNRCNLFAVNMGVK